VPHTFFHGAGPFFLKQGNVVIPTETRGSHVDWDKPRDMYSLRVPVYPGRNPFSLNQKRDLFRRRIKLWRTSPLRFAPVEMTKGKGADLSFLYPLNNCFYLPNQRRRADLLGNRQALARMRQRFSLFALFGIHLAEVG